MQKIAIGCDPNADELKQFLKSKIEEWGHSCTDFGSEDPVYANTAFAVAEAVADGRYNLGVLLCGTGIGMSIAANKVKGAYAALVSDMHSAERAKKSNNANIICLGAFTIGRSLAEKLLKTWIEAEFTWGTASEPKVRRYMEYENEQ
jgi:ribose 5-phosphate isomerase B